MIYRLITLAFVLFSVSEVEGQSSARMKSIESIRDGDNYLRMGNWTDALASYNNAVVADPGFADAYMKRAMVNKRIGANVDATADYNRAIALNPYSIYIYDQRFKVELLAFEYYAEENKSSGTANLSPIQLDQEADYYINFGAYEKALDITDSLIKMGFEKEFEYEKRALVHLLQGDYENCENDADSALMISKTSALPYDLKGLSQMSRGQFKEAIASFSKAIETEPDFSVAYLNRAIAQLRLGNNEAALADLQTSIEKSQQSASTYYLHGVLLGQKGEMKRSLDSYDRALEMDKSHTRALFNRSFTWKMMGDFTKAMEDARMIVELEPESPEYWNLKGNMHMLYGEYYEAISCYDKAIGQKSDYAEAYHNRGLAFLMSYTPVRGCQDLLESQRLGYTPAEKSILNFCGK